MLSVSFYSVVLIPNTMGMESANWASEASPTLDCSVEISRDIYMYMYVSLSMGKKHTKKKYAKIHGRNYVAQTRACSKSVLGG